MVALVLKSKVKPVKGKGNKEAKNETREKPSKASTKVDKELLRKAVKALLKHHETETSEKNESKAQLLGTDTSIQVQFTLELAPVHPSRKPYRIDIPHSIFKVSKDEENEELEEPEVCIIVKDGSKDTVKELIDQFPEQMGFIKKVMTLDSLRKKHSRYNQRRALLKKYSVFMADDRILPMLTKCLGKDFLKAKKHPIPVQITRAAALPVNIFKALSATFLHLSEGTCAMVRAGFTHMSADQLVDNIMVILEKGIERVPRRWANIRALAIKTPTSMSLPFYNKTPAELAEIARLAGIDQVWQDKSDDDIVSNDEGTKDEGDSPKKRKEIKSPLVQALKKQKKMENEAKEGKSKSAAESTMAKKQVEDGEKSKKSSKKQKQTNDEINEDIEVPETKAKKEVTEKNAKKEQKRALKEAAAVAEDEHDNDEMKEAPESKPPKSKRSKVDKETIDTQQEEKSSSKKKKRTTNNEDEEESPKKNKVEGDFIPSKKYTGSKKGYVFYMGPKGLGYYVDIKPVPDKAALAALARMANQGKARGERRKSSGAMGKKKGGNKGKGRRSF